MEIRNFIANLFVLSFAGFLFGVWLVSLFDIGKQNLLFLVIIAVALFTLSKIEKSRWLIYFSGAIFILAVALGGWRYYLTVLPPSQLKNMVGQKVSLTGTIAEEPDERESVTYLTVEISTTSERILVSVPRYPRFKYGDNIKVSGKLSEPENFDVGTSRELDYKNYLAKDGIRFKLNFANAELISSSQSPGIISKLIFIKNKFITSLYSIIPEPEASLGAGIVLGAKQGLGKEWNEYFRRVGLSHMIVLSGYNITIVADTVLKFFSFLPRNFGIFLGVAGVILFTLMTGASSTAVRAAIMALIAIVARATGRVYDMTIALIVAGVLMVIWNPRIMVFDLGFQLSFLATAGLIWLSPIITEKAECLFRPVFDIGVKMWLRKVKAVLFETLCSTLAAQIMVLPWILYKMGSLSIVALPANLLVLPLVPITMFFSFFAASLNLVSKVFAAPLAYIAYGLLAYMLIIIKAFASIPFALIDIKRFPLIAVIICYSAIFWWIRKNRKLDIVLGNENK